jgi:hypothetical protein
VNSRELERGPEADVNNLPYSRCRRAGRNEIDDTQELNIPFHANAIADSGFTGFVAHEYRPSPGRDPIKSLEQCFEIMNV